MLGLADIKSGKHIVLDGDPYTVTWNVFGKTARQGGVMKTKLKNLITGRVMEKTFQGSDKVEEADIRYKKAQFLYAAGDQYDFMDQEDFDTVSFMADQLGNQVNFISEGMDVDIQYFNGSPINVQLPAKMTFTVIQTDPGVKGDTAGSANKDAVIDTGYKVKVPLFINKDEKIVVNTLSGEYIERAK